LNEDRLDKKFDLKTVIQANKPSGLLQVLFGRQTAVLNFSHNLYFFKCLTGNGFYG
jgi:hypothetical protein